MPCRRRELPLDETLTDRTAAEDAVKDVVDDDESTPASKAANV